MKKVRVTAWNGSYDINIGDGIYKLLASDVSVAVHNSSAFVVADRNLPAELVSEVRSALEGAGVEHHINTISASEKLKTLASYEELCAWLLENDAERTSAVIALGGGIIGDISGFVASTFPRGIPFFQVPTTLLSMVDASVGGKVAVNLRGAKNIVGSFYQPSGVYASPQSLHSLDRRQVSCGLAECIKHGIIGDRALFDWTVGNLEKFFGGDDDYLTELVYRNVAFKAKIVGEDATELSVRAWLNLGHTFGHAIEKLDVDKTLFHGEAVSIGTIAAAKLAATRGTLPEASLSIIESAFSGAGLPIRLSAGFDTSSLVREMKRDKKSAHKKLRIILPRSIGSVEIRDDCSDAELADAFAYVIHGVR
jgi:3-dehydroquinate synthase